MDDLRETAVRRILETPDEELLELLRRLDII